jgi:hypothetical protein
MASKLTTQKQMGEIRIGDSFVFDDKSAKTAGFKGKNKPSFYGKKLTVAGFRKGRNNVIVKDESGIESLFPSTMIERILQQEK